MGAADLAHEVANVMIARHAVNAHIQRQHEVAEALVGGRRVILDEVAGNNHAVGPPVAGCVMIQNPFQGCLRHRATQFAVGSQQTDADPSGAESESTRCYASAVLGYAQVS